MGFPRASLLLLVTLPGCGLFLDAGVPENPRLDARDTSIAMDAGPPDGGLDAALGTDAFADDAFAEDAFGMDAPRPDAHADDVFRPDAGRDAAPPPPDAPPDAGSDAGPPHPCPTGFCGPLGPLMPVPETPLLGLMVGVVDFDVSEDGTRLAILTELIAGVDRQTIIYRLEGGTWVLAGTPYVTDPACSRIAVADTENTAALLCPGGLRIVGATTATFGPSSPTAVASGGRFFAVAAGRLVRVYDLASREVSVPTSTGAGCALTMPWTAAATGFAVTGLAMRSEIAPPGSCAERPRLAAGTRATSALVPRGIANLAGALAECTSGMCCSTPLATAPVDGLRGSDISVLGSLVASASDFGRPSFAGASADQPAIPIRDGGPIVSVSLGRHPVDTHFVLGSVHTPLSGLATAWLQLPSRTALTCDVDDPSSLALYAPASGSPQTLRKIRISDCSDDGWMTAAVLESPVLMGAITSGTAHVFRVRCPVRLP